MSLVSSQMRKCMYCNGGHSPLKARQQQQPRRRKPLATRQGARHSLNRSFCRPIVYRHHIKGRGASQRAYNLGEKKRHISEPALFSSFCPNIDSFLSLSFKTQLHNVGCLIEEARNGFFFSQNQNTACGKRGQGRNVALPAKASTDGGKRKRGSESLLLRRLVGKGDTLLDVALQALDGGFQQRLLLGGEVSEDVDGLLGSVGLIQRVSRQDKP